jgi:hypothetical protein
LHHRPLRGLSCVLPLRSGPFCTSYHRPSAHVVSRSPGSSLVDTMQMDPLVVAVLPTALQMENAEASCSLPPVAAVTQPLPTYGATGLFCGPRFILVTVTLLSSRPVASRGCWSGALVKNAQRHRQLSCHLYDHNTN